MTLLPVSKQNEGEGQIPHQNAQTTPPANAEPVSQNSALVASVPPPPDVSLVQTFQKDCDRIYASIRTKQDVLTDDAIKLREEASEKVCDTDFLQEVRTFAFRPPDISWMPWDGTPKMEAQKGRRYASSMLVDIESLKRYNSELGRLGRLSEKENGILAEAARSVADSGAKVVGKLATQLKMEEDARQQLTVRMQGLEDDVEVSDNLLNAKNLEIGELNKEVTSVKKKLQVWHDRLEASVLRVDDPRARTTQVSPDDTVATNPSKDHKDRPQLPLRSLGLGVVGLLVSFAFFGWLAMRSRKEKGKDNRSHGKRKGNGKVRDWNKESDSSIESESDSFESS